MTEPILSELGDEERSRFTGLADNLTAHIGADHAGYWLKEEVGQFLQEIGYEVVDHGAEDYRADDNYVEFARKVGEEVAREEDNWGVVICGSGQGVCNVAAKAAEGEMVGSYYGGPEEATLLSRQDNDTSILSMGARTIRNQFHDLDKHKRHDIPGKIASYDFNEEPGELEEAYRQARHEALKVLAKWRGTPGPEDERHQDRLEDI